MNEKDMKNNSNTINEDGVVKAEYLRDYGSTVDRIKPTWMSKKQLELRLEQWNSD